MIYSKKQTNKKNEFIHIYCVHVCVRCTLATVGDRQSRDKVHRAHVRGREEKRRKNEKKREKKEN